MERSELSQERRVCRWRSLSEKRQIVQAAMEPGTSVAEVARAHGLNANQLFKWRRAWERGELSEGSPTLLPVTLSTSIETLKEPVQEVLPRGGSIHIELTGRALISVEHGADPEMVRCILESVSK
jgi:transposase